MPKEPMKVSFSTEPNRRPTVRTCELVNGKACLSFGYIDVMLSKVDAIWLMSELARTIAQLDSEEQAAMEKVNSLRATAARFIAPAAAKPIDDEF